MEYLIYNGDLNLLFYPSCLATTSYLLPLNHLPPSALLPPATTCLPKRFSDISKTVDGGTYTSVRLHAILAPIARGRGGQTSPRNFTFFKSRQIGAHGGGIISKS